MAVRERSNGWQADVTWKGKRFREQFATEKEARLWEHEAAKALRAGKPLPPVGASSGTYDTIAKLLDVVIKTDWGMKEGSGKSIIHARKFVAHVGPETSPRDALTQANVDEFISALIDENHIGGSTVNRYLSAISKLSKKAFAAGLIDRKLDLSWQQEGECRLRWFTDEEEAAIVATFRGWNKPRMADFFIVLCDTGARTWKELGRLQWRDVSASSRLITFWDTKNGDSRSVPLTARALEAIERQRGEGADGPFTSITPDAARSAWDRLRASYPQFRDATWYTCRHTFASRLVQRGVDLYRTQKLLGHRSPAMTMRYAKLAPKHLAEAIEVLEPARHVPEVTPPAPRHEPQKSTGLSLGLTFQGFQGLSPYGITINRPVVASPEDFKSR